jgi:hypothetical protein
LNVKLEFSPQYLILLAPLVELPLGVQAIATASAISKMKANHLTTTVALDNFLNQRIPNITTTAQAKNAPMEIKSIHRSWKAPQF